jgi:acyl dehydratase
VASSAEIWPNGRPQVGQTAQRSRLVSSEDIQLFNQISGDINPLHDDETVAKASPFGEIIVQSGVSTAVFNVVLGEDLPGPGTIFLQVDWGFKAPVRPGDTITGIIEVLEVRDDKPISKLRTTVIRQDGVVAIDGTALCYTLPSVAAARLRAQ